MHDDEMFPLEAVPSRVKLAILREFKGRRPTIHEVDRICDRSWLAVPGIGQTALAIIRQATGYRQSSYVNASVAEMSDAELLRRLEALQEEFRSLIRIFSTALAPASKKRLRSEPVRRTPLTGHGHQGSGLVF